jgi:HK97 family phage portal protein
MGLFESVIKKLTKISGGAAARTGVFAGGRGTEVQVDSKDKMLQFSAVYACVSGISFDIAKLHLQHKRKKGDVAEVLIGGLADLFKRPNQYQTQFQFIQQWVTSKLLTGNTYVLKKRKGNKIEGLYILEPDAVQVLVSDSGEVFYELKADNLSAIQEKVTVPAIDMIHDRYACLFHPLVGISPIYACGYSATMGNAITNTSAGFFQKQATPGGILTAPGRISDETAARLRDEWQSRYSGQNAGRVAVLGDGLKFERMVMTATDAQLIEQLRWTIEDIARAFRYPLYKLGAGTPPISNNVEMLNLEYYSGCLQPMIEAMESVMDLGFDLKADEFVEFDLNGLSRMDTQSTYNNISAGIKGGFLSPNEGRKAINLPPVEGGDGVFLQQQNYSTEDLAKLRSREFEEVENPEPAPDNQTRAMLERIKKGLLQ